MAKHTLVVMTNAQDGKDDEFNEWYTNVHLTEVLGVDGFVAAQRFKLADAKFGGASKYNYLALYEIETDDLQGSLDALKKAAPKMQMSEAMADGAGAWAFSPITDRVAGKDG
ncbi:MAG: hypothetical protein K0U93_28170 [Gammaproteobacteria bacterium]|nr:hypothetical protein [Gammaproteobacteria bacterium]